MRKSWLTTTLAAWCACSAAVQTAEAIPFVSKFWGEDEKTPATTATVAPRVAARPVRPTEDISPVRHPVKYMAAAVSEMPLPGRKKTPEVQSTLAAQTAQPHDALRLDEPTAASPQLLISLAQMADKQGDVAQARQHYQAALKQWPGHVDVLLSAARMEDRLGNMAVAEGLYQQAVVANPQHAGAHNDLGLCLARQGKLQPSIQEIERAIQLQPEKALYRNNAATVLVVQRNDQAALAHLAAVHGPAQANFNLGQLMARHNRAAEAAAYYVAALEIDPSLQAAQAALAQMNVGTVPTISTVAPVGPVGPVAVPQTAPTGVPQQAMPPGPQLGFPETAQSPAWGTSSYAPPAQYVPNGGYAPNAQYAPPADPRLGQAPRYLPPTAGGQAPQVPTVDYRR